MTNEHHNRVTSIIKSAGLNEEFRPMVEKMLDLQYIGGDELLRAATEAVIAANQTA